MSKAGKRLIRAAKEARQLVRDLNLPSPETELEWARRALGEYEDDGGVTLEELKRELQL